jgi:rare lipoprotein A
LDNGKSVVVKINDRGPFHDDRLIDLSYGAAVRLGMTGSGTARVEVRAISFDEPVPQQVALKQDDGTFLQVGAFKDKSAAEALAGRMMREHLQPVSIQAGGGLYKVWIGPYESRADINFATRRVVELGLERPHTVKR